MGVSIVCDNYCPACGHLVTRTSGFGCQKYGEQVYKTDFDGPKEFERELPIRQSYVRTNYKRQRAY